MTNFQRSSFGRVPAQTVDLLQGLVASVRDQVLSVLPSQTSAEIRSATLELLLEVVLRDWRENDNVSGLAREDIDDLRSFVRLATTLAGRGDARTSLPIYQATLRGLLEDWLHNWNSPNDPGPPGPIN